MKYLSISITAFILFFVASCKKDETKVIMNTNTPILSSNINTPLTLLQDNINDTVLRLTYDDINLGFNDALGYVLQISLAGHNFKSDSLVETSLERKALSQPFTTKELNTLLLSAFSPAGRTRNYELRIRTTAGNVYSNIVPLTITTYEDWPRILTQDFLLTPGAYQGWDPASSVIAKMYVVSGNKTAGKLSGSINLTDPSNEFKFTPDPNWSNSFGSVSNTGNAGTLLYNGGGNFAITGKGYYKIDLDLTAKTWKAVLSDYSIIGDGAIDWNTDVDLDFDPATQTFYKVLPMKVGEWKFRMNHTWNGGDFPGTNLKITETGTYKVLLDMRIPSDPYWKIIRQ